MIEERLIVEKTARQLELINPVQQPEQLRMLLNEMKETLIMHSVSSSYSKYDMQAAFTQARCNKHNFEEWYKYNYP